MTPTLRSAKNATQSRKVLYFDAVPGAAKRPPSKNEGVLPKREEEDLQQQLPPPPPNKDAADTPNHYVYYVYISFVLSFVLFYVFGGMPELYIPQPISVIASILRMIWSNAMCENAVFVWLQLLLAYPIFYCKRPIEQQELFSMSMTITFVYTTWSYQVPAACLGCLILVAMVWSGACSFPGKRKIGLTFLFILVLCIGTVTNANGVGGLCNENAGVRKICKFFGYNGNENPRIVNAFDETLACFDKVPYPHLTTQSQCENGFNTTELPANANLCPEYYVKVIFGIHSQRWALNATFGKYGFVIISDYAKKQLRVTTGKHNQDVFVANAITQSRNDFRFNNTAAEERPDDKLETCLRKFNNYKSYAASVSTTQLQVCLDLHLYGYLKSLQRSEDAAKRALEIQVKRFCDPLDVETRANYAAETAMVKADRQESLHTLEKSLEEKKQQMILHSYVNVMRNNYDIGERLMGVATLANNAYERIAALRSLPSVDKKRLMNSIHSIGLNVNDCAPSYKDVHDVAKVKLDVSGKKSVTLLFCELYMKAQQDMTNSSAYFDELLKMTDLIQTEAKHKADSFTGPQWTLAHHNATETERTVTNRIEDATEDRTKQLDTARDKVRSDMLTRAKMMCNLPVFQAIINTA